MSNVIGEGNDVSERLGIHFIDTRLGGNSERVSSGISAKLIATFQYPDNEEMGVIPSDS